MNEIKLPQAKTKGSMSVEEAIKKRRSIRIFKNKSISIASLSQLVWVSSGITGDKPYHRAAPSAGATLPLEVYAFIGKEAVEGISEAIYRYLPEKHSLELVKSGDFRKELASAAREQKFIMQAPISIVITAVSARTTNRYHERGIRYINMEVEHVGQNIYLQAESLGLSTVAVGAFDDFSVNKLLELPNEETALYIMPIG